MPTVIMSKSYTKKSIKFFKRHPNLLETYAKTLKILEKDPNHPSLRLHKLKGKIDEYYSVSLNMKYRILLDFIIRKDVIILLDIGGHELYD